MPAASTSSAQLLSKVRVGIMCYGQQAPASLLEGLGREVIETTVLDSMSLQPLTQVDVLLLWLAPGAPARVLRDMIASASLKGTNVGVIGCAPHGDVEDTVAAFEAGIDDFVAGRAGVRELASRIHALRQRLARPPSSMELSCRELQLNARAHEVRRGTRTIQLSSTELSVLRALLSAGGRTLSRIAILELAWGDQNMDVGERAVDNVLLRLRRKLGEPQIIETVRGVGFRLALEPSRDEPGHC